MTQLIPNIETIVSNYLRVHAGVTAFGARVVQKPPANKKTPWIEVQKLDALNDPNSIPEWLISYMVQFDCYAGTGRDPDGVGGGPPEATGLALAARAALKALEGTITGGAVISRVVFVGNIRIPDEALDREILTATIYAHTVS